MPSTALPDMRTQPPKTSVILSDRRESKDDRVGGAAQQTCIVVVGRLREG